MDFPFHFDLNRGSTPEGIFEQISGLRKRIAAWDRGAALRVLAGLQLRPEFQVHQTRLDLATRLVVIEAKGQVRPNRSDLVKLINRDLARSGSALLEDPAEDFFIAPVCTNAGEFHIAEGLWEKSANFTESVIEAFSRLPDAPVKQQALDHAYAALSISQILIERAYLRRFQEGFGIPKSNIPLPSQKTLDALRGCLENQYLALPTGWRHDSGSGCGR
ncbi:hypothetical protein, partial [Sphingomonas sp. LaA6.9]|uniref:hypothetical protein n=1 Tax=Sphingomonas sp. LaA6.9 TaxID=2919914 RepID=UPI001F4FB30A